MSQTAHAFVVDSELLDGVFASEELGGVVTFALFALTIAATSATQSDPRSRGGVPFSVGARPDGQVETPEVAEPTLTSIRAETRSKRLQRPWIIGAKLGANVGAAGPLGSGLWGAIELGYRLPFASRLLGLSLEPAFGGGWSTPALPDHDQVPSGRASARSMFFSLPLLVTANIAAGNGLVRVAAGPSLEWFSIRAFAPSEVAYSWGGGPGFSLLAGYGFLVGSSLLEIALRYRMSPALFDDRPALAHSLSFSIGYDFLL